MDPAAYWENRYQSGGNSGEGSRGALRRWKWSVIKKYVRGIPQDVIDVGCGDLAFWRGKDCQRYFGMDLSQSIIVKDRKHRPRWNFMVDDAATMNWFHERAETVLCLDVLFHVISDDAFRRILRNLAQWTGRWLFIFTWKRNPFPGNADGDGVYERFRDLSVWIQPLIDDGLTLAAVHPYGIGAMYVFRRGES